MITLQPWMQEKTPVTDSEIAEIESALKVKLPADYVTFVQKHGHVHFQLFNGSMDDVMSARFKCHYADPRIAEFVTAHINRLLITKHLVKITHYLTEQPETFCEDEPQPLIPQGYIAIGGSAGQDYILMEMEPNPGRIWYWQEKWSVWGSDENNELGYIAESFTQFMNTLQPSRLNDED